MKASQLEIKFVRDEVSVWPVDMSTEHKSRLQTSKELLIKAGRDVGSGISHGFWLKSSPSTTVNLS